MSVTHPSATILVVDDLEENRDLLARRLRREGYAVDVAEDGESALAMLEQRPFDLLLLDVMMPGLSGTEVVTRVRATHGPAALPIIMVTAVDASEGVVDALERGASDYVTKPFSFPVLRARVRTQLRVKRFHDLREEFMRIASHDLKNPLTRVLGAASLVRELGPDEHAERDEFLEMAVRGCLEMSTIISDFLDFQALSDGAVQLRLADVDLNGLVAEVVAAQQVSAESKSIALRCALPPTPLVTRADPDRLRQVVTNLVSNAMKFSPPGTETEVRAVAEGDRLLVQVIDEGPGFTESDLERVFTRYARLSSRPTAGEKSTGLGLSICRQIVQLHGGDIGVRNNQQKGATVWFSVPPSQAS